jgi:hypothetical protein
VVASGQEHGAIAEAGATAASAKATKIVPLIMSALIKARSAALVGGIPDIDFHRRQAVGSAHHRHLPSPNDGHPSASDLESNASDGVRRVAAAVSRGGAAALGEEVAHGMASSYRSGVTIASAAAPLWLRCQPARLLKRHFGEAAELTRMETLVLLQFQLLDCPEPDLKVLIDALAIEFAGHASEFDFAMERFV